MLKIGGVGGLRLPRFLVKENFFMKLNRQKVIIFNYNFKLTKEEDEIVFYVAKQLSAEAFKLWIYLYKEGTRLGCYYLRRKRVQEDFGIKKTQYNTAIKELIERGYLVQHSEANSVNNVWEFYVMPVVKID